MKPPRLGFYCEFPFDKITNPEDWPKNELEARVWGIAAIAIPHYNKRILGSIWKRIVFTVAAILLQGTMVQGENFRLTLVRPEEEEDDELPAG